MRNSQNFWDKNAGRYDRFMRKDAAAYEQMYELLRPVVRHKTVLELATGTGLIAKNIVSSAAHIEATDALTVTIRRAFWTTSWKFCKCCCTVCRGSTRSRKRSS